jgi:hypothetical protein
MARRTLSISLLFVSVGVASAQPVTLAESAAVGDTFRVDIALRLSGTIKTTGSDGKPESMNLTATGTHTYAERVDAVDGRGDVARAVRGYTACESEATLPGTKTKRLLPASRRVVVVQKSSDGPTHFSPLGSLTRDELDVVAGHFDSTTVAPLLPGKAVNVGDTWPIPAAVVQAVCLFDGLTKHDWVGKLTDVKDGLATFTVTGPAEGYEVGAAVKLSMALTGTYDVAAKRVVKVVVEESDVREQGPVAPACEVKASLTMTRTPVAGEPAELTAADRAKVPADGSVPAGLLALRHEDPAGQYSFFYARDWYVVAATNEHLVMRLVDRGEFIAQATVLGWKKAAPGTHGTAAELKDAVARQPGWVAEKMTEDGEIPTDAGRWLYRLVAHGKQDDVPVVQAFHLLAGPTGRQLVITVVARQEKAARVGTRDVQLVNSIDLPKK